MATRLYNNQNQTTAYLVNADRTDRPHLVLPSNANYAMALSDEREHRAWRGAARQHLNGAAVGGKVQELTPSGQVVWEFVYSTAELRDAP